MTIFLAKSECLDLQMLKAQGKVYMPLTQISPGPGSWERQAYAVPKCELSSLHTTL